MKRIISIITVMAMILSMLGASAYAVAPTPEPTGDVGILANVRVKFVNNTKYGGIDRREGAYVQSYLPEDELIYEGSVTNVTDEVFYIKSIGFYLIEDRFETIDKSNIPTGSINIPVEPHSIYKVEVPVKVKPNITGVIGYTNGFTGTSGNPTSGNSTFYVSGNTTSQGYAPTIASFAAYKNVVLYPYADYTLTKRFISSDRYGSKYDVMIGVNEEMNYSGLIPHVVEVCTYTTTGARLQSAELKVLSGTQYNNSKPEIIEENVMMGNQGVVLYRIKCIFWMSGSSTQGPPHLILQYMGTGEPEIFISNQVYKNMNSTTKDYIASDASEDKCGDVEFALDASASSREITINGRTVDNSSTTYYVPDEDMMYTATVTNNKQYDIQVKNVQIRIPSQMNILGNNSSTAEGFNSEAKTSNNEVTVHFTSDEGVTVKPNEQIHFYVPVHTKADATGDICYTVYDTGYPLKRLYSANAGRLNPQAVLSYTSASGSGQAYANADLTYKNGLDFAVVMQPQINPSNNQKSVMLKDGEALNIPLKVGTTLAMFLYSKDDYAKNSVDWHSLNIQERLPEWLTLTDNITPYMGYTGWCYEANTTTDKGSYTEFNDKSDSYPYGRYQGSPLILFATINKKAKIGDTFTFSPHITGKVLAGKEDLSVLSGVGAYPQSGTITLSPYVTGFNVTQTLDTPNIVMKDDAVQYTIHIDTEDENSDYLGAVHFAVKLPEWLQFRGEYTVEGLEEDKITGGNGNELHFYGTMQKHATITYIAYVGENAKHGDRYMNTAYATTGSYANAYDVLANDPSALSATADEIIVTEPNAVSGKVWNDADRNGICGADENGIEGIMLTLTVTDENGDAAEYTVMTDENGQYLFTEIPSGTYTLISDTPDYNGMDMICTTNNQSSTVEVSDSLEAVVDIGFRAPVETVTGKIWNDVNSDTVIDESENGLPGMTVTFTDRDNEEKKYTVDTDENGAFAIELPIGEYSVTVPTPTIEGKTSICTTGNATTDISVIADSTTIYDAGFYVPKGSVSGYVWYDADRDGARATNELGIEGIKVTVTDKNDVTLAYEAVTDSTGAYSFNNIPVSEYEAVCATPTIDGRNTVCTTDIQPVDFEVTEGAAAEVDFGYVIPTGNIAGYVWEDMNESGTFEEDEPYIHDLTVTVTDKLNTEKIHTVHTNENGNFAVDSLLIGEYTVEIETPILYGQEGTCTTNNQTVDVIISADTTVKVEAGFYAPTPTPEPTEEPTETPTEEPTPEPTEEPTEAPTTAPTEIPTAEPTKIPTPEPTAEPTEAPTEVPTELPTTEPTVEPTAEPTEEPTAEPTVEPTAEPTAIPIEEPTIEPMELPTTEPTELPTEQPTTEPTEAPTPEPTATPKVRRSSGGGSGRPSNAFVPEPTNPAVATAVPTLEPSAEPTATPNNSSNTIKPQLDSDNHYAYIIGYPDGSVRPGAEISRAEVATIFFRMLSDKSRAELWSSDNSYEDVTADNWYNNAVSTLTNAGIVKGDNDTTFRPDAAITRAEFAAIAAMFADSLYLDKDMFSDIAGHWASEYINTAAFLGWIHGYEDGTFRPDKLITRAEAMTLINNVLDRHGDEMLDDMITWTDNTDTDAWYYNAVQEATNSHYFEKRDKTEKWTAIRTPRDWSALEN